MQICKVPFLSSHPAVCAVCGWLMCRKERAQGLAVHAEECVCVRVFTHSPADTGVLIGAGHLLTCSLQAEASCQLAYPHQVHCGDLQRTTTPNTSPSCYCVSSLGAGFVCPRLGQGLKEGVWLIHCLR